MTTGGSTYFYITNLQGDVVALLNTDGEPVVYYTYDAWGNILSTTGSLATTIGVLNPLRYRGYVYDVETSLYYLQSRYYDSEIGRFINADAFTSTGQGFTGNNMFAYCGNNPIIRTDSAGLFWDYVIDGGFIVWGVAEVVEDPGDWKNWAALGADVLLAVVPFVPSGAGQVIKVGNKIDNAADIASAIQKLDISKSASKLTMIGRNMERVTSTAKFLGISDNLYDVWKGYDKVKSFSKTLADAMSATPCLTENGPTPTMPTAAWCANKTKLPEKREVRSLFSGSFFDIMLRNSIFLPDGKFDLL